MHAAVTGVHVHEMSMDFIRSQLFCVCRSLFLYTVANLLLKLWLGRQYALSHEALLTAG